MAKEIIALTGGIGSGKSTALEIFKSLGAHVISCDALSFKLYKKCSVKRRLKKLFPSAVKGKIFLTVDRKILAKALEDDQSYHTLTSYVTPKILALALKKAKRYKGVVVIEIPLLFECKTESLFNRIVVVIRDSVERINATTSRSNLTKEQVLTRINRQVDYDKIDLSKYVVIYNDGTTEDLKEKITNYYKLMK